MDTMDRSNLRKGKRLFVLLALLLVTGLVFTLAPQAVFAWIDDNPDDRVVPIHTPGAYTPSEEAFTWQMDIRYGNDRNGDGMIDTYWLVDQMNYDKSYIFPDSWKVYFSGCKSQEDYSHPNATPNLYTWEVLGVEGLVANVHRCRAVSLDFPDQGTYTVRLTVHDPSGNIVPAGKTNPEYFEQQITIRDILIVAMGDSYSSGEGNPDIQQTYHPKPWPQPGWDLDTAAVWQDRRCHRSAINGPSMAAQAIEYGDPHTSVTFISFACSGATIARPMWDLGIWLMPQGSGFLGPHWGAEFVGVWWNPNYQGYIPPQMDRLESVMIPRAGKPARQIDSLIISGGGNDMYFGDILANCLFDDNCFANDNTVHEDPYNGTDYTLPELIERALGHRGTSGPAYTLPDSYSDLHARINALQPAKPAHVYLTQYPDMTKGTNGETCELMGDNFLPNIFDLKISQQEALDAVTYVQGPLNNHIREVAQLYANDNWKFVDGLAVYDVDPEVPAGTPGLFALGHDGKGHGYCASNNWIRRAEEAELIQGPLNLRIQTKGQMHPNYSGHNAYKERLLRYMLPDLTVQQPQTPPAFSFTHSLDGYHDVVSADTGWYLKSCTNDSPRVCQRKVVAQAVATSSVNLDGAQFTVNGVDGCTTGNVDGVSCVIPTSDNPKQVTFNVEITASGIYQLRFVAEDSSGQIASLEQEIRVDLDAPVLATPTGPFEVDEGGSVELIATASSPGENVFDYDWDLDNDSIFETEDEQPTFSAASLDGPESQTIRVKVTDRAGWTDTKLATVNVLNVAPTAEINGAPATSPEGTAISLTSTVTDPGVDDTFTYAWDVKKDGVNFTSGTGANFSFTPDDNGSYEVSLSVTDDDSGVGTASQTIAVTNVAPALSNVAVSPGTINEASSATLSGSISDAGSADGFALTIDWGDGSTLELLSLPAGSTSFSRSHTYADDNPTGTASDIYSIALSIADDDGDTGTGSASVVVDNLAPSLSITAPENGTLYPVNATANLSVSVTDPSSLDSITCSVYWDDGNTETGTLSTGVCTASHVYAAAGVYTIQVAGTDDDTGAKAESVMVVVYDPSEGFVTGGGWIDSPAGAYIPDPSLTGRAGFGFVSKYHRGATIPSGQTDFQFEAGGFYFESEAYDWLVVAGARAQFKGTGAVNGVSGYSFLLTLTDGNINGGGGVDKFRIKIWDASGVVYDNMIGYPEDMDGANPQAIGGGSIVIHNK